MALDLLVVDDSVMVLGYVWERLLPSWDFLLGDGIVANTGDTGFGAARATGQLLVAPVLAKPTTIAGADIAKVAALTGLGSWRNGCYRGGGTIGVVVIILT